MQKEEIDIVKKRIIEHTEYDEEELNREIEVEKEGMCGLIDDEVAILFIAKRRDIISTENYRNYFLNK